VSGVRQCGRGTAHTDHGWCQGQAAEPGEETEQVTTLDPMTPEQAYAWLVSGTSPAGKCTAARARKLLKTAQDSLWTHMTLGTDLYAPGYLLTWNGTEYTARPVPVRPVTPWHVGHSMRAAGITMAERGRPGWSTFWDHSRAESVRVEWHGHPDWELAAVKRRLETARWAVELVTEPRASWLRVQRGPDE
jgi:hypothetical protein